MAQLSIALAILVAALVCVYAIERIWFHQRRARAASVALTAGTADATGAVLVLLLGIALMILLVPVICVHLVQRMLFGRQRAETMQPAVLLQKVVLALSRS